MSALLQFYACTVCANGISKKSFHVDERIFFVYRDVNRPSSA